MKKVLIITAFVLAAVVLIATPFFIYKPGRVVDILLQMFSLPSLIDQVTQLRQENSDLRNQLFALENSYSFPQNSSYIYARVFSLYPFNLKNRLYINIGSSDGVKMGDAVLFSKTALVGQVVSVSENQSEVITLFDPKFSLSVKIGKSGIDGLLQGGVAPIVGLIDKTKQVSAGDRIVSASKDLPYGLGIGTVQSVKEDSSGTFFEVRIDFPYTLSDLTEVFVVKNGAPNTTSQ